MLISTYRWNSRAIPLRQTFIPISGTPTIPVGVCRTLMHDLVNGKSVKCLVLYTNMYCRCASQVLHTLIGIVDVLQRYCKCASIIRIAHWPFRYCRYFIQAADLIWFNTTVMNKITRMSSLFLWNDSQLFRLISLEWWYCINSCYGTI